MKKAILVPYMVDQNEPSQPIDKLANMPEGIVDLKAELARLYGEVFDSCVEQPFEITIEEGGRFGDLCISCSDVEGLYLYVTYISTDA